MASADTNLGQTRTIQIKIDTGNRLPIQMKPYRTLFNKRKIVDRAIDDKLYSNIIRRSKSPWTFLKTDSWPLHLIDDLLTQ